MAVVSFFISFLLFLYAALDTVLDYTISPDFDVMAFGFVFLALGHLLSHYTPGYFGNNRGRGIV